MHDETDERPYDEIFQSAPPRVKSLMNRALGHGLVDGFIPLDLAENLTRLEIPLQQVFDEINNQLDEMPSKEVH